MKFKIVINPKAEKILSKIDLETAKKLRDKIINLSENPRRGDILKLKGGEQAYRLRVGDYRVIYEIQDKKLIILVINIGHRKEIYKK